MDRQLREKNVYKITAASANFTHLLSVIFELHRMPELFYGFPNSLREESDLYPVPCPVREPLNSSYFKLMSQ
jgi:hypothetical protein